jgi:hypothetical protein
MNMRRKIAIITTICVVFAGLCWAVDPLLTLDGKQIGAGSMSTYQAQTWTTVGTWSAATTTPDATHRTLTAFQADTANKVVRLDGRYNRIRLRAYSTTAEDTTAIDCFLMYGVNDHFTRVGSSSWTTGTQASGTAGSEFADTVGTPTNANGAPRSWRVISGADNYIAFLELDVAGATYFGASPTTVTSACGLEIQGF